ncbi:MAG: hypothetical protein WAV31_00565 [Candidatus Moraniibacteriota bacterium]
MNNKKPKYIFLSIFPKGKTAITVYPYIFWSKKREGWKKECFIKHEMYHWNEQKKWKESKQFGLGQWLAVYCVYWFWFNFAKRLPANSHPMERLAYKAGESKK